MKILGIKQYGIQKYQEGTNRNGIQLNYTGPQYYEVIEKLRKENPMAYNRLQQAAAQSETSEISRPWIDADGNMRRSTNVGAGFVSGTDPVGALYVEGVATAPLFNPIFNLVGRAGKNLLQIQKKRSAISKINKELKKGIKENSILESYHAIPANKDIGTSYDYLHFLDNIYPNSKLNATFYHGGPKGITQFKSAKELGSTNKRINSGTKDYGIYLADDKSLAQYYARAHKKANRHLYNVRVNVQNPMRYETNNWYMDKMSNTGDLRFIPGGITQKWYDRLNLKNYDGIYHTKSKNVLDDGELVMFDGNNIHIMGTPEESQMFRSWKQNPQYSSKPLQEEIPLTPEQYDKSFLNYAKAATPGLVIGGVPGLGVSFLGYDIYQKSKADNLDPQSYRNFIDNQKRLLEEMQQNPEEYSKEDIEGQIATIEYYENILNQLLNGPGAQN